MNKAPKKPKLDRSETTAGTSTKRPQRESEQKAFERRDEWANSPGLQPPK
jgi:hypothetical protein